MAAKSSFLPRLPFSRPDLPVLPFHNPASPALRKRPSEYDLPELSPRPEDSLLPLDPSNTHHRSSSGHRSSSSSARYSDKASPTSSGSKTKGRLLFAGPPPPIATSTLLYRDEEDGTMPRSPTQQPHPGNTPSFARTALTSVSSVLFDRGAPATLSPQHNRSTDRQTYEPDTVWRNLQRRERALQKELQHLLDVQSAGLAAHLDPASAIPPGATESQSSRRSNASDAGSTTPTGGGTSRSSSTAARQMRERHVVFDDGHRGEPGQVVIPVRQPRRKPLGLGAARTALARNMTVLADLKAEEDAVLTAALGTRKKALAHLRRLAGRREGIVEELEALEGDREEPLGRELRELGDERKAVSGEIAELEERLVGLRSRKRWLDGRIDDVKNRRDAGLSGYKNALREVDATVLTLLKRPPVKPLDLEVIGPPDHDGQGGGGKVHAQQSPGGDEFLRLRPERRTVEMARDWWEGEIKILENRKGEVDKDRTALEEGVQVWKGVINLVSDFETRLRREMRGEMVTEGTGKNIATTPEEAMSAQLDRMAEVIAGLEEHLRTAEDKGWNLLICAIGAELEAFKEAEMLLRQALGAAGFGNEEDEDDGLTPQLGRSTTGTASLNKQSGASESGKLVEFHDELGTADSDNEVPPDLLVAHEDEHDHALGPRHDNTGSDPEREDSEDDVPPEFLAEHRGDGEIE